MLLNTAADNCRLWAQIPVFIHNDGPQGECESSRSCCFLSLLHPGMKKEAGTGLPLLVRSEVNTEPSEGNKLKQRKRCLNDKSSGEARRRHDVSSVSVLIWFRSRDGSVFDLFSLIPLSTANQLQSEQRPHWSSAVLHADQTSELPPSDTQTGSSRWGRLWSTLTAFIPHWRKSKYGFRSTSSETD